jgi:transcriptional regulator with XRE-family HTH domain
MATRSPTELHLKNAPPGAKPAGVAALTWERRTSFGPYLRGLRDAARLSLRAASEEMAVSFSYLAKLETGEKATPPSLKVLQRIAIFYGRDLRELMHEAGFQFETPPEVDAKVESVDAQFLRLVTHPALRPMRMDAVVMEMIPPLVKRQWIEFARKLEKHLLGDSDDVDAIVARPAAERPQADDDADTPPRGVKPGRKRRTT